MRLGWVWIILLNVRVTRARQRRNSLFPLWVDVTVLQRLLDFDTSTVGRWMEDEGSLTGVESYLWMRRTCIGSALIKTPLTVEEEYGPHPLQGFPPLQSRPEFTNETRLGAPIQDQAVPYCAYKQIKSFHRGQITDKNYDFIDHYFSKSLVNHVEEKQWRKRPNNRWKKQICH